MWMTMVSEAENDGELTDRESELIRSAIEFDDVEVEEILTPRVDVIAVEGHFGLPQPDGVQRHQDLCGQRLQAAG